MDDESLASGHSCCHALLAAHFEASALPRGSQPAATACAAATVAGTAATVAGTATTVAGTAAVPAAPAAAATATATATAMAAAVNTAAATAAATTAAGAAADIIATATRTTVAAAASTVVSTCRPLGSLDPVSACSSPSASTAAVTATATTNTRTATGRAGTVRSSCSLETSSELFLLVVPFVPTRVLYAPVARWWVQIVRQLALVGVSRSALYAQRGSRALLRLRRHMETIVSDVPDPCFHHVRWRVPESDVVRRTVWAPLLQCTAPHCKTDADREGGPQRYVGGAVCLNCSQGSQPCLRRLPLWFASPEPPTPGPRRSSGGARHSAGSGPRITRFGLHIRNTLLRKACNALLHATVARTIRAYPPSRHTLEELVEPVGTGLDSPSVNSLSLELAEQTLQTAAKMFLNTDFAQDGSVEHHCMGTVGGQDGSQSSNMWRHGCTSSAKIEACAPPCRARGNEALLREALFSCSCGSVKLHGAVQPTGHEAFYCHCSMCPTQAKVRSDGKSHSPRGAAVWVAVPRVKPATNSLQALETTRSSPFASRSRCRVCGDATTLRYDCESHTDWVAAPAFFRCKLLAALPGEHSRPALHCDSATASIDTRRTFHIHCNSHGQANASPVCKAKLGCLYRFCSDGFPCFPGYECWVPDPCHPRRWHTPTPSICSVCFLSKNGAPRADSSGPNDSTNGSLRECQCRPCAPECSPPSAVLSVSIEEFMEIVPALAVNVLRQWALNTAASSFVRLNQPESLNRVSGAFGCQATAQLQTTRLLHSVTETDTRNPGIGLGVVKSGVFCSTRPVLSAHHCAEIIRCVEGLDGEFHAQTYDPVDNHLEYQVPSNPQSSL